MTAASSWSTLRDKARTPALQQDRRQTDPSEVRRVITAAWTSGAPVSTLNALRLRAASLGGAVRTVAVSLGVVMFGAAVLGTVHDGRTAAVDDLDRRAALGRRGQRRRAAGVLRAGAQRQPAARPRHGVHAVRARARRPDARRRRPRRRRARGQRRRWPTSRSSTRAGSARPASSTAPAPRSPGSSTGRSRRPASCRRRRPRRRSSPRRSPCPRAGSTSPRRTCRRTPTSGSSRTRTPL